MASRSGALRAQNAARHCKILVTALDRGSGRLGTSRARIARFQEIADGILLGHRRAPRPTSCGRIYQIQMAGFAPAGKRSSVGRLSIGVTSRHALSSVFHQRHTGRLLRSSCRHPGRRVASSRRREFQAGRCSPLWPGDLRNDGGRAIRSRKEKVEEAEVAEGHSASSCRVRGCSWEA